MPKKLPGSGPDLLVRAREAEDLPAVLSILNEAKGQEIGGSPLAPVLNILEKKAAEDKEGRVGEALQAAEDLFRSAAKQNGGKPQESLLTVMIRMCCKGGAPKRALGLVEEAVLAGTKLKLRTWAAILAQAAETGDRAICESVWTRMTELQLEPQDSEFASMLRCLRETSKRQLEILHQMLDELPLPSDPPLIEELGRVFGVSGAAELMGAEPPFAEGLEDESGVWRVGWTSVDEAGSCRLSKRKLQALDISSAEEKDLLALIPRLSNDSGGFRFFQRWFAEQAPFDVIIDGANVGFNNQNHDDGHFQYDQIDTVVQHLRNLGQRTLLVLHPKWLEEDADLKVVKRRKRKFDQIDTTDSVLQSQEADTDEIDSDIAYPHDGVTDAERDALPGTPLHLMRRWKESGVLLRVPFYDCDDWYWLYAALESFRRGCRHVQVITNDQMRDHHWRMCNSRSFLHWQERHMTRFSIQTDDDGKWALNMFPARPFSLRAQVAPDGRAWHFPVPAIRSRAEQLSSGRPLAHKEIETAEHRWLVAWQDAR
jgi:hypothetical protein